MSDYTLTKKGAEWAANRIISSTYTKDIDTMYIVYTNGGTDRLNLDVNLDVSNLMDNDAGLWCLRKEGGVIGYINTDDSGVCMANLSCVVTKDDIVDGGDVELSSSMSKIIAVAVAVSGDPDTIIAACNITDSGTASPVQWVDNMSMSISCPIMISPYPNGSTK